MITPGVIIHAAFQPTTERKCSMETTKPLVLDLVQTLGDEYAKQLEAFPIKKPLREALVDGFRAGCAQGAFHALQMVGVTIHE